MRRPIIAVAAALGGLLLLAPPASGDAGWRWPVRGGLVTLYVNDNARPYAGGMHRGIDIAADLGTTVVAARAGTVTYAGPLGSAGNVVAVRDGTVCGELPAPARRVGVAERAGRGRGACGRGRYDGAAFGPRAAPALRRQAGGALLGSAGAVAGSAAPASGLGSSSRSGAAHGTRSGQAPNPGARRGSATRCGAEAWAAAGARRPHAAGAAVVRERARASERHRQSRCGDGR